METSSDNAAYELTWSAKYTSSNPLDHRPLTVCLQLKEGRQHPQPNAGHNDHDQDIIRDDRKSKKRKNNEPMGSIKSRPRNKPSRIWTPSVVRARGTAAKADSSTAAAEDAQWDLRNGDDIVQQSLRAMQQE